MILGVMGDVGDINVSRSAGIDRFAYEVKGKDRMSGL